MTTFLTGATGYLGSYLATGLLRRSSERLAVLVRAKDADHAEERLWKSLQLHMDFDEFEAALRGRIDVALGDLTTPQLGLDRDAYNRLVRNTSSVIHCAASLNRKSAKSCLNTNLRGTLEVIKLGRAAADYNGLRRFSDVSTTAIAGTRDGENVAEDDALRWELSDYDPYGRTKKFCEHMVAELLPEVSHVAFRPSTVLGDSRFPETTQFDMVRAFVWLSYLPVVPLAGHWKMDIVPADYVSDGLLSVHLHDGPVESAYHLSSGVDSPTYREITTALERDGFGVKHLFAPELSGPFGGLVGALMNTPRSWGIDRGASLMKVFLPYLTYNTTFDNERIATHLGYKPRPFTEYAYELLRFAVDHKFSYPHEPLPRPTGVPVSPMRRVYAGGVS